MKVYDVYSEKKRKYEKYVVLIKVGNFYETYGEDSLLMNNLFDYKIKQIGGVNRVGFPLIAYNKVINKLKCFKINYLIIEGAQFIKKKFNLNNCDNYITNGDSINIRINRICDRLRLLKDSPQIKDILDFIDGVI